MDKEPWKEPWKRLKSALVKRYLDSRAIENPNAFEVFLTRSRRLKELCNMGLIYIILCDVGSMG